MRRTQIYLTDEQRQRIARLAADGGLSQAAVIRRILDEALGVDNGARGRLAAVAATAGLLRDAPDWPEWLAGVRIRDADARLGVLGL
ncbi:MAG: ribbon-helix-helix protein, CopG family [Acidimicrobiia bacterium]|nr:ribbon-helix-helix protein, CopG family [Acidimicrobiia bacterium]